MEINEQKEILENVLNLLNEKKPLQVINIFRDMMSQDVADILCLPEVDERQRTLLFRLLPKAQAAEVFVEMEPDIQQALIGSFNDNELHLMLDELFVDDTVDIIEEMPAGVVHRIIKNCTAEMRTHINKILEYPGDSAGSIMTPEFISLQAKMTVAEAFQKIRATGLDSETIYTCYVIGSSHNLKGVVSVKELLLSPDDSLVGDIMTPNPVFVETTTDKEEVAKLFDKYDVLAFPVVDKEERLVGIITVDDAIDVIREEATEDFSKMAAVVPIDESYFHAGVFKHARNRLLWLIILMVSATITGAIIANYQEAFKLYPLLIACLPMMMDTGGNCGSQTSTMVIRGMATDEMRPRDVLRVWWKEIRIAMLIGLALSVVNFGRVLLIYGFDQIQLALTTSLALIFTVALSQTLGCILPMAAKACKLDPAIMASPLITTIVDALSVTVFFAIAVVIFQIG